MNDGKRRPEVGDESVAIGKIEHDVGNRSVYIGATDDRGNTILRPAPEGTAIGYRAHAGPGSLAIGAFAGAGPSSKIDKAFIEVGNFIKASGNRELLAEYNDLIEEIRKDKTDKPAARKKWLGILPVLRGLADAAKILTFAGPVITKFLH